ncbi:MAG: InlB B-repeat-containing protein [Anaeroplasma sp.]
MKKRKILVSSLALLLAGTVLASCSNTPSDTKKTESTETSTIPVEPVKTYTIKFVDYDGTELSSKSYEVGQTITKPNNPTRTGYTFVGWDGDNNGTVDTVLAQAPAANLTYKAVYVKNYGVRFVVGTDDYVPAIEVTGDTQVTAPTTNPTKNDYEFIGWDANNDGKADELPTTVSKDTTFVALFKAIKYTVTFVKEDGVTVVGTQTYTVENKNITEPEVPAKAGYTAAWEEYTLTSGNIVVKAVYTRENLKLDAFSNFGTFTTGEKTIIFGDTFVLLDGVKIDHNDIVTTPDLIKLSDEVSLVYDSTTLTFKNGDDVYNKVTADSKINGTYSYADNTITIKDGVPTFTNTALTGKTYLAGDGLSFVVVNDAEVINVKYDDSTYTVGEDVYKMNIKSEWIGKYYSSYYDAWLIVEADSVKTSIISGAVTIKYDGIYWGASNDLTALIFTSTESSAKFTYHYTSGGEFVAGSNVYNYIADDQFTNAIDASYDGIYKTSSLDAYITISNGVVKYTTNENTLENSKIYYIEGQYRNIYYILIGDYVFSLTANSTYIQDTDYNYYYPVFDKEIITTIPSELQNTKYASDDAKLSIGTTSVLFGYSFYGQMMNYNYFSINDGKITIFKSDNYFLDDVVCEIEVVDDVATATRTNGTQYVMNLKNIALADVVGDYKSEEGYLSITETEVTYKGVAYDSSKYTLNKNTITLQTEDGNVVIENIDDYLVIGQVKYEKIIHIELYDIQGTYQFGTEKISVGYAGITYNEVDYSEYDEEATKLTIFDNTITLGTTGIVLTYNRETKAIEYNGNSYTCLDNLYGTYRVGTDNTKVIEFTETSFAYNGTAYEYTVTALNTLTVTIEESSKVFTFANNVFTCDEEEYTKLTNISLSSLYGTYRVGTDNTKVITIASDHIEINGTVYDDGIRVVGNDILIGSIVITVDSYEGTLTYNEEIYNYLKTINIENYYGVYQLGTSSIIISDAGISYNGTAYTSSQYKVIGSEILIADVVTIVCDENTIKINNSTDNYILISKCFGDYKVSSEDKLTFNLDGINLNGTQYALTDISITLNENSDIQFVFGEHTLIYNANTFTEAVGEASKTYTKYYAFPSSFYGEFENTYGTIIISEENGVIDDNYYYYSIVAISYDGDKTITVTYNSRWYGSFDTAYVYDDETDSFTVESIKYERADVLKGLHGTYINETLSMVISRNNVDLTYNSLTVKAFEFADTNLVLTMSDDSILTFVYDSTANTFTCDEIVLTKRVEALDSSMVGTWTGSDTYGDTVTITITKDGTITYNNDYCGDYSNIKLTSETSFTCEYFNGTETYEVTVTLEDGTLKAVDSVNGTAICTKQIILDSSMVGTWTGSDTYGDTVTITITKDGTITYNNDYCGDYSNIKLTSETSFTCEYFNGTETYEVTVTLEDGTLKAVDSVNGTAICTKQA